MNILLNQKTQTVTMMALMTVMKLILELIQIIGIQTAEVSVMELNGSPMEPTLSIILAMIMLLLTTTTKMA